MAKLLPNVEAGGKAYCTGDYYLYYQNKLVWAGNI